MMNTNCFIIEQLLHNLQGEGGSMSDKSGDTLPQGPRKEPKTIILQPSDLEEIEKLLRYPETVDLNDPVS